MNTPHTPLRKKASLENQDLLYSGFSLVKSSLMRDLASGRSPDNSWRPGSLCSAGDAREGLTAENPADLPTEKQIFSLLTYFSSLYGNSGETPPLPPEDIADHPALRELWRALNRVSEQHLRKPPENSRKRRARAILNMAEHFTTGLINDLRVADRRAQEAASDDEPDPDELPEYEEGCYSDDAFPSYVFALFQETLRVLESLRSGAPKPDRLPLYALAPFLW